MKNQIFNLFVLLLLTCIACQPPASTEETESIDYAAFDTRVEVVKKFMQAHSDEKIDVLASLLADTVKYSPPTYNGNKWLNKEEYLAVLKGYHDAFENITFQPGIATPDTLANGYWSGSVFPQDQASNTPNAIRIYGTWTAKYSETGIESGIKWFGLAFFNDDHKITMFTDYFDWGSMLAKVSGE